MSDSNERRENDDGRKDDKLQIDTMTVAQMREELKRRKLKVTGNKVDLVARLKAALVLDDQHEDEKDDNEPSSESDDEQDDDVQNGAGANSDRENDGRRKRSKFVPTFKDVEESIDAFNGDDGRNVESWIKEFEDLAELCEWNPIQKTIYAKRLLRGSARLFVKADGRKTWRAIKIALKTEFSLKVDSRAVHKELQRRKKKTDESYHEYCYKMAEIAARANVEKKAVIQYIIDGIDDEGYRKSVLYGAKSIRELKDKFDIYVEMRDKTKPKPNENKKKSLSGADCKDARRDAKRCYNCGDSSHLSIACPSKEQGTKCFGCNKYGHIAARCPESKDAKKKKDCNIVQSASGKCCKDVVINGVKLSAIIDSGSDISLMCEERHRRIGSPTLGNRTITFRGAGSVENATLGDTRLKVCIDMEIYDIVIHVVRDGVIPHGLLIGSDFLNQVEVFIKKGIVSISRIENDSVEVPEVYKIDVVQDDEIVDLSHVKDDDVKDEVKRLIGDYRPRKEKDVGIRMNIVVRDDIPVTQSARRLSALEKAEVEAQIRVWLEEEIIRPSYSDYASPIVLAKKKNGSTRICVDYRRLNEKIVKTRYPLPLIEDQLDLLQGAKVYSTLDLKNGFFHVAIEESSRKYTAFIIPNGHYKFLKMPFGLSTSPAYFQKYVNAVFHELTTKKIVAVYMDDVIIPSTNIRDGLSHLKLVLETAAKHGLSFNWKKCQLLKSRVNYLGYVIENGEITPSEEKTKAVKHFPTPTNVRALQGFLGLTGYFRKFIPRYAYMAGPLSDLLKDGTKFVFGKEQKHAFNQLKQALSGRPVLRLYCPTAETELHTDASALGFGAILLQRDNESRMFHPVYYASGKTTPTETKYDSYKLEILAIIKALKKFRVYLIGIPFTIVTDCKAFMQTMKKKDICAQVARWALFLEDFQYAIVHRPGTNMKHVDALSRHPLPAAMMIEECQESILAKLRRNQMEDERLRNIIEQVEKGRANGFTMMNGLLCKEIDGDTPIVVPKLMQTTIIRQIHEREFWKR